MRCPTPFHTDPEHRRGLYLAVFINLVGCVYVREVSGTKYHGYVPHLNEEGEPYKTKGGGDAHQMTQEEYIACVKEAHDHFCQSSKFRRLGADILLVHDRGPCHPKGPIPGVHWRPVQLPPHSPDLDPLDYGIFGTTKTKLGTLMPYCPNWEKRVSEFQRLLREAPMQHTIEEFTMRLQACIAAKGLHLMDELKKLKKRN